MQLPTISRRSFLRGTLALGAVGPLGRAVRAPTALSPALIGGAAVLRPWSMAMHIHACFSEGTASMEAQLDQAARNSVEVVWWTEHEFRMTASGARQVIHFNGLSEAEDGLSWTWTAASAGTFTEKSATFVGDPISPTDPSGSSALRLVALSTTSSYATYRLNGAQYNSLFRTSLDGTTLELDVCPLTVGPDGYLGLFITTSQRPAGGGQTAGTYTLEYRVGGDRTTGSRVAQGRNGIVTIPAATGSWTTVTIDPVQDMAALWPWFDGRDSSLYGIGIGVGSRLGTRTDVVVDHLRFNRVRKSPQEVLALQAELAASYATRFPTVTQHAALEWSMLREHMNWFGGTLELPAPTSPPWKADTSVGAMVAAAAQVHRAGGVASYNHPFGNGVGSLSSQSAQDALRRTTATDLISNRAYGCDILEVGLPTKGGVAIEGYLSLWDALSRNAVFLTGTGVSDDHTGKSWLTQVTNFFTWAWSDTTELPALTHSLASGRVYFGDPNAFRGQLDLLVDGTAPMGSVCVGPLASRSVRVVAAGLPSGGSVQVVRGVVDYAGAAVPDPVTTATTYPASAFAPGYVDLDVDTRSSCFVRAVVRDNAGKIVAGSNPVWMLREEPVSGIPPARRAATQSGPGPRASFSWTADAATVSFDGSSTVQGDSPVATYSWQFGDGTTSGGPFVTHTYPTAGVFTVILTVSDEAGRTDTISRDVTVSTNPPPASLVFVGGNRTNASTKLAKVTVPSGVQAGDGLLLFLSVNSTGRPATDPPGWSMVGQQVTGTQVTRVLTRLAADGDADTSVQVPISGGAAKVVLEILAYRGVTGSGFATATSEGQLSTASHTTPAGDVVAEGSWVVSYWTDKSAGTTTTWTPPAGVTVRGTTFGSAGGALSTLSADSGGAQPVGPCGGLLASANSAAGTAITWTVVVRP